MRLFALLVSGVLTLAPMAALAQEPAPAASPTPQPKPKRICRRETETGTIIGQYICHTKEEWAAIAAANAANNENTAAARERSSTQRPGEN